MRIRAEYCTGDSVVKRFENIEEFIKTDQQGQKVQGQDLTSSVYARLWDELSNVLTALLVISSERPSGTKYPKVVKEYTWEPIHMSDLKETKQAKQLMDYIHHLLGKW